MFEIQFIEYVLSLSIDFIILIMTHFMFSAPNPPTSPKPADFVVADHAHPVAYTGILTSDLQNNLRNNILVFNEVITDVGGAYDTSTGVFTCPVKGIYLFGLSLVIYGDYGGPVSLDLVRTSKEGETVLAKPRTDAVAGIVATGEVAVTKARAGDEMIVRYSSNDATALIKKYTRFSAVLIQELV